jgi:hypothetical protein
MATLNTSLKLKSSNAGSDKLDLTASNVIAINEPFINTARTSVTTAADFTVFAATHTLVHFAYLKNTDSTNSILIKTAAAVDFGQLGPGESCLVPIKALTGLAVRALVANCIVEYGFWSK